MSQNKRNCQIKDHLDNLVSDVCIYPKCDRENRWVCIDCIKESIHSHGQKNTKHIINSSQSVVRLKQNVDDLKKDQFNQLSQGIKRVKETLQQIIIIVQENLKIIETLDPLRNIRHQIDYYNELIEKIDKQGYFQLMSNEDINILLGPQPNQYIKEEEIINKIIRDLDEQVNKIRNLHQNKIPQIDDQKYNEIITLHQQNTQVTCASLSSDELIFAYVTDKRITLISTFSQLKHLIENTYPITCCQFSQCSKYLIYGDSIGNIFKTPINVQNLNTFSLQVCRSPITNIASRSIQNTYISNTQNQMIKICLETNKYQFEVKVDIKIDGFDYQQNLNVISLISYKTIQLRDGSKGTILLTQLDSHQSQINQILTSQNQLFTLDQEILKIWKIGNKTLSQISQLRVDQQIFNFSLVNDFKNIVFICQNKMIIKDFNNNQIAQYDHTLKFQSIYIDLTRTLYPKIAQFYEILYNHPRQQFIISKIKYNCFSNDKTKCKLNDFYCILLIQLKIHKNIIIKILRKHPSLCFLWIFGILEQILINILSQYNDTFLCQHQTLFNYKLLNKLFVFRQSQISKKRMSHFTDRINKKESVSRCSQIYQKYMIIRLQDMLYREQIRFAFQKIKNMKIQKKSIQNKTVRNIEFKSYSVSSEIICPKLKGEPFFLQDFDISKSPKKKRQDKINLEQVKQENNDLVESMLLSREIRIKNLDNIRQLMQFQGETLKIKSSTTYKTQTQTNVIIYLALFLFIFLWVFIIDC